MYILINTKVIVYKMLNVMFHKINFNCVLVFFFHELWNYMKLIMCVLVFCVFVSYIFIHIHILY